MHKAQSQVRQFRLAVSGQPTSPARPALRDAAERARFIAEEAAETIAALVGGSAAREIFREISELPLDTARDGEGRPYPRSLRSEPDLVEAVDGIVDGIYVYYGAAEGIGVDLEPYFDVVHAANMAKEADGEGSWKRVRKPPGWTPPNGEIRRLLLEAGAELDP